MNVREQAPTAATPLPDGWGSFCSNPSRNHHSHWYATAPWHADTVKAQAGDGMRDIAEKLEQTVSAATWPELHAVVAAQVRLYASLMAGEVL
ncbi:hypothetical protein OG548_08080 [Streptomyces sp. NBC_01356]|uniref:hypothetical protein n=1 Tax=Streptomyces sp. NBC_01356 TaxID=2903836 RepID=UPI002E357DDE|nr:hypothetical protein [Streptomyces sp. NBC_01356]